MFPPFSSRKKKVITNQRTDGRKVALDVSVTSPTLKAFLHRAAETAATAIEVRKASKNRVHIEHCHVKLKGVFFHPLVVESFGSWDFLKKLATKEARRGGKTPAVEIKHFFQRLSIALLRGNATLLIARDFEPV